MPVDRVGRMRKVFLNRTQANDAVLAAVQYLPAVEVLNRTGTRVGEEWAFAVISLANRVDAPIVVR